MRAAIVFAAIYGCVFPKTGVSEESANHWAFQRLKKPETEAKSIDPFVLERLREADLKQNGRADKRTLIRRVTLDLTGLPPTREEIDAFLADESEDAWETLVERLLASPHYGERWGRHWLDVARYVQGTIKVPGVDRIDLAEPYRDYVVKSFNEDKPYDRFVAEQLAGDLLPVPEGNNERYFDQIVAPAFLSIGHWFDECTDPNKLRLDIIDEQISTVTKAFLAIDFACARCHDHKFDPVPTRDYYALAGIFRNTEITSRFSEQWKDGRPRATQVLATPEERAGLNDAREKVQQIAEERWNFLKDARNPIVKGTDKALVSRAQKIAPDLLAAEVEAELYDGEKEIQVLPFKSGKTVATQRALLRWVKYYVEIPKAGVYHLVVRHASPEAAQVKFEINGKMQDTPLSFSFTGGISSEHYRWQSFGPYELRSGRILVRFLVDPNKPMPYLDKFRIVQAGAAGSADLLQPVEAAPECWPPTVADTERFLTESQRKEIATIDSRYEQALAEIPEFDVALAVSDTKEKTDLPIHISGKVYQTSEEKVPRGTPTIGEAFLADTHVVPRDESGRLQLAGWLTDPGNPLTARVLANRVWHWHFGKGIVRTTDDFGMQGADPTHPELLDFLAAELEENNWSIKHLQRLILLSDTYRISSEQTPENVARDPDGALFSRYPRRRLEVEAIYDSMLTSIGKVPRQPSGEELDTSRSKDRALYILTSSRSPLGLGLEIRKMFPLFGFDNSGRPMHNRDESTTPTQALWWLNNPLPLYYADKLAEKILAEHDTDEARVAALVEMVLAKDAKNDLGPKILSYVKNSMDSEDLDEKQAWSRAALGLFSTETFSYLE